MQNCHRGPATSECGAVDRGAHILPTLEGARRSLRQTWLMGEARNHAERKASLPDAGDSSRSQQAVTGTDPVRVLLVDAEPLQRSGWRLVIDSQDDLEVVGEAGDGVQALALL